MTKSGNHGLSARTTVYCCRRTTDAEMVTSRRALEPYAGFGAPRVGGASLPSLGHTGTAPLTRLAIAPMLEGRAWTD